MGRELERLGAPFRQPEWSALALMEAPEYVAQAHQNFIDAGADVITTNAYALVPFHIGQDAFEKQAYDLAANAAQIARQTARKYDYQLSDSPIAPIFTPIKIAGCIPPAFGSYKPELFNFNLMESVVFPIMNAQIPYIDFWLVETISSIHEASAVISMIQTYSDLPIWVSFTLYNREDPTQGVPTLRSGEKLDGIQDVLPHIDAVLFNCSQPEEMNDAIKAVRAMSDDIAIGAYPNAFSETKRTHDANEGLSELRTDITPDRLCAYAEQWIQSGATIIGGCCGITPDHIQALSNRFKENS